MEYIHIKNLEKYHPGYKDRNLLWFKMYFTMVNGDPEFEMIESEVDKWRFAVLIMLELQAKKPIPLDESYLASKGFRIKKRPIRLTLQMLHNFIEVVTKEDNQACIEVEKIRSREDKDNGRVTDFFNYFVTKTNKNLKLTAERQAIIKKRLEEGRTIQELKTAVDNFVQDDWQDRHKFIDIVYCIGVRNKIDNLDKWLNSKKQKTVSKPRPNCDVCKGTGKIQEGDQKGAKCFCVS